MDLLQSSVLIDKSSRKQARSALELKTQSIFADAFDLQERLAQQKEEKSKQRALCEQLAQQVSIDQIECLYVN